MLEEMARAYCQATMTIPDEAFWQRNKDYYMGGIAAALKVLRPEIEAIYEAAQARYPNCADGSDFEEFTVRVREFLDTVVTEKPT